MRKIIYIGLLLFTSYLLFPSFAYGETNEVTETFELNEERKDDVKMFLSGFLQELGNSVGSVSPEEIIDVRVYQKEVDGKELWKLEITYTLKDKGRGK